MKLYTSYMPYIKAAFKAIKEHRKEKEMPYLLGHSPCVINIEFKEKYGFQLFISENGGLPYFETDLTPKELIERLKDFMPNR